MRITLSGDLGSGKSSVGKRLSEQLGIPYYSAGKLFREIGQISNMDALTTNLAAETNTDIDVAVDARTRELDRTIPDFIIDSRMAWYFVTKAVRVFLSVLPETAAARILADDTRQGEKYEDATSAIEMLRHRRTSERKRYRTLYQVDIEDRSNFDLWIISDDAAIDDICEVIRLFAEGHTKQSKWIPKTRLVPLRDPPESGVLSLSPPADEHAAISLTIVHNFGLYSGDSRPFISALKTMRKLLPFQSDMTAPRVEGEFAALKSSVDAKKIAAWERATGQELTFRGILEHPSQ